MAPDSPLPPIYAAPAPADNVIYVAVLMGLYAGDDAGLFERAMASTLEQVLPTRYRVRLYLGVDGPIPPELESVLKRQQSRIYAVSRSVTNIGLAKTLNRLIAQRGDESFFFRMDADDVSLPGRFAAQLAYLEVRPDIDILGTAMWECAKDEVPRLVRFANGPADARRLIDRRVPVAHPTVCMRRRVLDRLGGYPERRGNEDIAMWFACLEAGFSFDNLAEPLLEFTVNEAFWKRRSLQKAFSECRTYIQGIWRLYGLTWRYVFPLARLTLRLSPMWISRVVYASGLRS